jgi:hypothetical protein
MDLWIKSCYYVQSLWYFFNLQSRNNILLISKIFLLLIVVQILSTASYRNAKLKLA